MSTSSNKLTLICLDEPTEADHMAKCRQIKDILKEVGMPQDMFGFSANLGPHGAFCTEQRDVYDAVQKYLSEEKSKPYKP